MENADYQHFLLNSHTIFKRLFPRGHLKSPLCHKGFNNLTENHRLLSNSILSIIPLYFSYTFFSAFIPFPNNFRLFKTDRVCRQQNSRKFFKRIENTVGKGEIARNEQFLLFPQCFQKTYIADT